MMKPLSLYELNQLVSETIQVAMPNEYWVEAELSEAREVRGHCYMELVQKDVFSATPVAKASAKCWKNKWAYIRPRFEKMTGQMLRSGMKVLLKVYADFHAAYGFSWIVTDIDPTYTMGEMARKRQEIIRRLKEEGVFELQRELQMPLFAQRIAVISSEQAAGYGDFCNQLAANEYGFRFDVALFPAVMQGEQVGRSIVAALDAINDSLDSYDVVVIIRGGGATSDLSGFDDMYLAENVANFPLPIITGIGHERDESILDMISHTRVKTPTAAAAFLVDHLATVWTRIQDLQDEMVNTVRHRMDYEKMRLDRLSDKIPAIFSLVKAQQTARLDQMMARLAGSVKSNMADEQYRINRLGDMLQPYIERKLIKSKYHIELLSQRLKSLDPMLLLQRGYSITLRQGKVVKSVEQLKNGDDIETRVWGGTIASTIHHVKKNNR